MRGSIRFIGGKSSSSILIRNVFVPNLPMFAIESSNLKYLLMDGLTVDSEMPTSAFVLTTSSTDVEMIEVDARKLVKKDWITGQLANLFINKCRLNLAESAFGRITFSRSTLNYVVIMETTFLSSEQSNNKVNLPLFSNEYEIDHIFMKNNYVHCNKRAPAFWNDLDSSYKSTAQCGLQSTLTCTDNRDSFSQIRECENITAEDDGDYF